MTHRFSRVAFVVVGCLFLAAVGPLPAHAEGGILHVIQKSEIETLGTWTMLQPSGEKLERGGATFDITHLHPGRYTLIIRPPLGMATHLELIKGNELLQSLESPQVSFDLAEGDELKLHIAYTVVDGGTISVSSDPKNVRFELSGPDNLKRTGVTPASYSNLPQGNYSVRYLPKGCPVPASKSALMGKERRADFSIKIVCSTFEPEDSRGGRDSELVGAEIEGKEVTFVDVPSDSWFAPYVATVARRRILTGYRDEAGTLTGFFGPGSPVTIAELSKIAHEIGSLNEKSAMGPVIHAAAPGTWFEQLFTSAAENGWVVYQDPQIDPHRPATRTEVVLTLLQVLDLPMEWPKGDAFDDVTRRTPWAGAIETAFRLGLVEGTGDGEIKSFHPDEPVNRAEISKIIIAIQEKYQQKYDLNSDE